MENEVIEVSGQITERLPNEIVAVIKNEGLDEQSGMQIGVKFMPFFGQAEEWKRKAMAISVTDISQVNDMKMARVARLALREIRIAADKTRKDLKEDSLRYGKAVQGVYNVIEYIIAPIEKHLEEQEKFAEVQEAKRQAELKANRDMEVQNYSEFIPFGVNLGTMSDDDYAKLLTGAKLQFQAKLDEEARIEAERIAAIKAQEAERQRMIEENNRLKAEREAQEKLMQEERAKAEQARLEAEKKAAKERAEADAKIKAEREAREKLEREAKEKADAERMAKEQAERAERERLLAIEQSESQAKSAPDKEKLFAFAFMLDAIQLPDVASDDAKLIVAHADAFIKKLIVVIREKSESI